MDEIFIIEVIPLATLPNNVPQLLSYFFDTPLAMGALVEIIIGHRKVNAIAISSTSLEEQKGSLKKSIFQLKRLSKVINPEPRLNSAQFKILLWLSRFYFTPLGLSLKTVFPSFLWNKKYNVNNPNLRESTVRPELIILRSSETIKRLHALIKETPGQVLITVPDKTVLDHFCAELNTGFPTAISHSDQSIKEKFTNWQKAQSGTKLIIGTRQALLFPYKNLEMIVVEDPLNEMYKSDMTPKYNAPDMAEKIAHIYGARLVYISTFAGVNNYYKSTDGKYDLIDESKRVSTEIKIINTVNELRANNFSLIGRELREEIFQSIERGKKVLIFSPRKGYSGLLLCQNCGTSIKCPNCNVPMRVHKSVELILICHRCSYTQKLPNFCSNCNSYKLKTAGPSGSQKIYDEIRELISEHGLKATLLALDSDIARNETEIGEIISEIKKPGPAILVASQIIFSHRYDMDFDTLGVVNGDALSAMPDYDSEERFLYHLKKLLDFEPKKLYLQTYTSENNLYKKISTDNLNEFYTQELETRKLFNYPPFCRLIKLSFRHPDQKRASIVARMLVEKLRMALAQEKLSNSINILDASSAFVEKERGYYIYNVIIKIPNNLPSLKDLLKYVPIGWSIEADPKTIL